MTEILLLPISLVVVVWIAARAVAHDPALRWEAGTWTGQILHPRRARRRGSAE